MRKGFLVLGMGLSGVRGSRLRNNSSSSARCLGSDLKLLSSLEYSDLEVWFWGLDSWSDVRGDESMLGVQWFACQGKLVLLLRFDLKV